MSHTVMAALPSFIIVRSAANPPRRMANAKPKEMRNMRQRPAESSLITETTSSWTNPGFGNKKKEPLWQYVQKCVSCCKLDKGPSFPYPEEIFDDQADIELDKSMIGPDGWCLRYDKSTRNCTIYDDRPYFCRVDPDIFQTLYGIEKKKFNK